MEGLSLPIVMSLGVHLWALLFGCVVSFGVCNLCLNTYRRNRKTEFDCITEVENQNLSQVHPWHHTQCVLLISSRCQISKISYSHVQDSQVTTLWSFLVVRNCFENLSWYFLVKQETLAPVTSQRSNYCNFPWFILTFSGHVIPAENLLSVALDKGPAGKEFDFTFQSRDSPDLVRSIPLMLSCVFISSFRVEMDSAARICQFSAR